MNKPISPELEALRQRWRELLKRAQEKGGKPTLADIEAANVSNDPVVFALLEETKKALDEQSERLFRKLKVKPEDFEAASKSRKKQTFSALRDSIFKP